MGGKKGSRGAGEPLCLVECRELMEAIPGDGAHVLLNSWPEEDLSCLDGKISRMSAAEILPGVGLRS